MALTFYYGSGSPYAWRVWLGLEHKQIPYEQKTVSFSAGDLTKPEFLALNPRHKVPTIVDEGFALYESVAILEYLEERHRSGPALFPGDIRNRAVVRRLVQEADQYYALAMEELVEEILFKPQEQWNAQRIGSGRERLTAELAMWERAVPDGAFLAGEVSAADFTLYPLIALTQRMQKKKPDLEVQAMIGPKVAAWMTRVEGLAYFQKTWPPHWK
jgi:glutathione S-transferase